MKCINALNALQLSKNICLFVFIAVLAVWFGRPNADRNILKLCPGLANGTQCLLIDSMSKESICFI